MRCLPRSFSLTAASVLASGAAVLGLSGAAVASGQVAGPAGTTLVQPAASAPAKPLAALPTPPSSAQPRAASSGNTFSLKVRASGLQAPVFVGSAPGDTSGLWVAQQGGQLVRVSSKGRRTVQLSIAKRTKADGERGLLGVAFLPGFASNRLVVLNSTNLAGNTRIELWRIGSTAKRAKLVRTLLKVAQPYPNHNGGQLAFGVGDRLYLGLGDGGSGDDPQHRAQNSGSKLGKILAATVTATNKPSWQVAAYGLRNPWRFWFDPLGKELWVGDVGQNEIEEIDRIPTAAVGAPNLGWSVFEGGQRDPAGDDTLRGSGKLIWPVITYRHDEAGGCSVIGGQIYRGTKIPALGGRYVYGDFCSGNLWTVEPSPDGGVSQPRLEKPSIGQLTSFGAGADGELYASSLSGTIYALVAN